MDAVEPQVRVLLAEFPRMPTTVRGAIGRTHSVTILNDRVRQLRPLFLPSDPTDRIEYAPASLPRAICGSHRVPIPVSADGARALSVLAMTCGYSRVTDWR